ncbi:MAG: acetyl-CoA C-acyltransferase, partial [Proteobacteria bacterium]|nr:acetyl-CoA C-acyltransferase [Pseudomonadota bacterium]MBU2516779.1 acetyl-CoA C-acyltransferase [Pseudomonadota bacterium]
MREVVITSAVRTAVGAFLGGLSSLSATDLGATIINEAMARSGLLGAQVDECIMGCVL